MLWIAVCLIAGALMLYFGSEWLVRGGKGLAIRLGVTPFVIGLTVLAFGSSAPEAITSVVSVSNPSLIIGNVVGSNIANVGLAIGIAALAGPMIAKFRDMKIEIIVMIAATVGLCALGFLGNIGFFTGIILIALLFVFLYVVFTKKKSDEEGRAAYEEEAAGEETLSTPILIVLCVVGLVLLYFGARIFITGAKDLAALLGASDMIIGLIVVAIGTSLPEICISVLAARRGEADLAVANIVGSNIFNIFFVLGIGSVLTDIPVSESMMMFHMPVMMVFALAMFLVVYFRNRIERLSGLLFVSMYAVYIGIMAIYPSLMI
jgi:cation:H+ antiporter